MKKINNCPVCKCEMWLPDELCDSALKSAKIGFFCAYGHKQHFSEDCIKAYWSCLELKPAEKSNVIYLPKKSSPQGFKDTEISPQNIG